MTFTHRLATEADLPAIRALMDVAIAEHLKAFLDPAQVELSKSIMGLDTQLIADRTYFLVEEEGYRRGAAAGPGARRSMAGIVPRPSATRRCWISRPTPRASAPCTPTPTLPGVALVD